ncbi:MAG: hypothetical protein RLZZ400_896 [Actinomycetota bacterium]|jgi:hypothetical protein
MRALAICLSLLAAVALAFGAQLQNDSVSKHDRNAEEKQKLGIRQVLSLFAKPKWLSGMSLLFLGGGLQITAISLAPLIVVQPLGGIALVITALLNARVTKTRITGSAWFAMSLCTFGIGTFVVAASFVADEVRLNDGNLLQILGVLGIIVVVFGVLFFTIGQKFKALAFILGAGVLYGFVASLIKAVVQRIAQQDFNLLTFLCVLVTVAALLLGAWFVQNAYASGPPDLVIAGLTVIDPMVAVSVGVVILGEAQKADALTLSVFVATGLIAVIGVWLLSKVHPELADVKK